MPILTRRRLAATLPFGLLAAAPRAVRAQALEKLRLLISTAPPDPAFHVFYFAQEKGFYRAAGLDVAVVPTAGDTTAVRVLLSGGADLASVGALPSLQAVLAGGGLQVVSCFNPKLDYLLVTEQAIGTARELEGKAVAVSQVGATSQVVAQLLIKHGGGDPAKVRWLSVGASSARVQALLSGRVAGSPLNASFAARAQAEGQVKVMANAASDLPEFVYAWELAAPATIQKRPQAVQAFVTATAQAARWAVVNPVQAAAISQKLLPDLPASELSSGIANFATKQFWGVDGRVTQAAWDFTVSSMRELGALQSRPSFATTVVGTFGAAAAAKLGPFAPP